MFKSYILVLLCMVGFSTIARAQSGAESAFNSAIDAITCNTIKVIHQDRGRNQEATDMDCLTYEGILASIPEDESATTKKLASDVNAYKAKFAATAKTKVTFTNSLDAALAYAKAQIEKKPRKADLVAFKSSLTTIRADALSNFDKIQGAGGDPNSADGTIVNPGPQDADSTGDDLVDGEDDEISPNTADDLPVNKSGSGGTLAWVALLIALAGLALAAFTYSKLNSMANTPRTALATDNGQSPTPKGPLVQESQHNYKLLSEKLSQEVHKLTQLIDEKLNAAGIPTGTKGGAQNMSILKPVEVAPIAPPIVEETSPQLQYVALPRDGRSFSPADLHPLPQSNSVFEVEVLADDPQRALYYYLNYQEVIDRVLAQPEIYLHPYAKFDANPNGTTKLSTVEEGVLEMQDGRWTIVQKTRVGLA